MKASETMILKRIRAFFAPLAAEIKRAPDLLYCLLLGVFHFSILSGNVRFNIAIFQSGELVWIISALVLILLGIYTASILVTMIRKKWALIPSFALLLGFLYLCAGMQRDLFDGLMIALLAIGAYGKNYKKLLKVLLWCTVGIVILALIGIPVGLTIETPKVGAYGTGLSFGFAHPNVFGSYMFFIFVTIWYLYIRNKPRAIEWGYYALSWAFAVFMVFVPKCRTQALLLILFPLAVFLCRWVVADKDGKRSTPHQVFLWILIATPILCFLATVLLGTQREWLVTHTFGTYIENSSKRFIQAGLAFKEHGFPLFGKLLRFPADAAENLGGHNIKLYVLDNGYVTYAILRGMIWMVPALLWLGFANFKTRIRRDYGLLAISVLFCLMGLMERYTFEIYNYVFLYPLASVVSSESKATGEQAAVGLEEDL